MQVEVLPEDHRSLRFLWREDPTRDVEVYQYTRHFHVQRFSNSSMLFSYPVDSLELHVFGDSRVETLCCRISSRQTFQQSSPMLSFVFGKVRVAPMKPLSIPKLELQASLLAARLKGEILKALAITIDRIFLWTDSASDSMASFE